MKKWSLKVVSLGMIAMMFVFCAAGLTGCGSSEQDVVGSYFAAIERNDPRLLMDITSEAWKDNMLGGWGYSEKELLDEMQDTIDRERSSYHYGSENIKITWKIVETYRPNQDELNAFIRSVYDICGYSDYKDSTAFREAYHIDDACWVQIEYTVTSKEGTSNWTQKRYLIHENGQWRLTRGTISVSWP